jgi:endonuclease/exonuclease/phosphatase family metal-dependent hydrolase
MSPLTSRRATALLLTALCAGAALPAAASAKAQDLKVMTRNVYLGADLIPLAAAPDQAAFEQAAAQRFQTVQNNAFPTRAKALAAEIRKAKPDIVGVQEATIWRRGPDGLKDGSATPATQVIYDSSQELRKALNGTYKEVVGRDWFDFEAPTALGYDVRVTQRNVILVRKGSKVKVRKTFSGQFKDHFDPPTPVGVAHQLRGWVGLDGTLARKKFRFVSTHLEAKKRQSILVGDYNADPADAGANAYKTAVKAGFRNNLPRRKTCCFAEDLHSTADHLETWIDHVLVRPKVKVLKSGIVGTKQVGGLYPSDHAGITATLRLK